MARWIPRGWRTLLLVGPGLVLASCGAPSALPAEDSTTVPVPTAGSVQPTSVPDALPRPAFSIAGWKTDFSRHSVPLTEIQSGGPPRDGIPPIDQPNFVSPREADPWLKSNEPVVLLEVNSEARAYPIQILIWHEIVNDTVGGVPVAVTFCPLCNTAIAFDRRLDGRVHDFGTTGNLRHSDLVMWDRQTESWWQQVTGEAIVGELTGRVLIPLPASIVSYVDFKTTYPGGQVLSRETGAPRNYGRNPYAGYDDINSSPFLFTGKPDGRLRPMERVVTVSLGGQDAAYPFSALQKQPVALDTVGGRRIVVLYRVGTASALDRSDIAESRDVGAAAVYEPVIDGQPLSFRMVDGAIADAETGSHWNVLGQGVTGPLAGKRLPPVVHGNHFWFAWSVFKPETRVWQPD